MARTGLRADSNVWPGGTRERDGPQPSFGTIRGTTVVYEAVLPHYEHLRAHRLRRGASAGEDPPGRDR